MGHCSCREGWTCPWCSVAIERAEGEREHGNLTPIEDFDVDAEAAALYGGGGW